MIRYRYSKKQRRDKMTYEELKKEILEEEITPAFANDWISFIKDMYNMEILTEKDAKTLTQIIKIKCQDNKECYHE